LTRCFGKGRLRIKEFALPFAKAGYKMVSSQQIIDQTKKWIAEVVIGCNFCPFAARVIKQQTVFYKVETTTALPDCLESFLQEVARLDNDNTIETAFLIFPNAFKHFDDYLDLVAVAEKLLKQKGYNGIYQLASFHPLYMFADAVEDDAANFTNRSLYPMLHLLRESSIDKALEHYDDPEAIPERNINFAREKGIAYMKMLRDSCL
jgi:uncharacterized protein